MICDDVFSLPLSNCASHGFLAHQIGISVLHTHTSPLERSKLNSGMSATRWPSLIRDVLVVLK